MFCSTTTLGSVLLQWWSLECYTGSTPSHFITRSTPLKGDENDLTMVITHLKGMGPDPPSKPSWPMEFLQVSMGFLDPDSMGLLRHSWWWWSSKETPQTKPAQSHGAFPKRRVLKCSPRGIWPVGGDPWGKNWWVFCSRQGGFKLMES